MIKCHLKVIKKNQGDIGGQTLLDEKNICDEHRASSGNN
jgi:hypothetical protein